MAMIMIEYLLCSSTKSEWLRARKGPRVGSHLVRGKKGKKERERDTRGIRPKGTVAWNGMEHGMAMRRGQFALNCRIGRVSSRGDPRFFTDFRSRFFSSNNRLLAFAGNERIEDTYVQVCPSRDSSHVHFRDLHADDDACRWASKNRDRDLTNRQFPPSSAYMLVCVFFFAYIERRKSSRSRRET